MTLPSNQADSVGRKVPLHQRLAWFLPAVVVGGIAAAIRFIDLSAAPLWRDEAIRGFYSRMSPAELFRSLQADVNLPLYHLLLLGWSRIFGTSEFALRSSGALLGGAAAFVLVWALVRPFGRATACYAGLILAFSAGHVLYCQELGVYSLLVFLVALAIGCFDRLVAGKGWPAVAGLALALAGMLYTHLWAALFWASLGLVVATICVVVFARRRQLPAWLMGYVIAQSAAIVLFLPWFSISRRQAFSPWMEGLPPIHSLWEVFSETFAFWYASNIIAALLGAIGLIAFVVGVLVWTRPGGVLSKARPTVLLLASALFFPLVESWAISPWKSIYYPRYALLCLPPFCAMLAIVISRIPVLAVRIVALLLLLGVPVALSGKPAVGLQSSLFAHSPLKAVEHKITAEARPGDVIVIYPEFYATTFNWYYHGDLPEVCYPAIGRVELPEWHSMRRRLADPASPAAALAYIREHLGPNGRIWTVYNPTYTGRRAEVDYGKSFEDFLWRLDMDFSVHKETSNAFWEPQTFEFNGDNVSGFPARGESREPVLLTIFSR